MLIPTNFLLTLGLALVEDGDAQRQAQRVVPVLFDLFAEGEVAAVGMAGANAC